MAYRCVAGSEAGFIQQLAVSYVSHGYWFYVRGRIPEGKDPQTVDAKLIQKYNLDVSKWVRARRKKEGGASVQYLRFDRDFVILATHGIHEFFEQEGEQIQDIRKRPLWFREYAIGCRKGRDGKWHASVRIERNLSQRLKQEFVGLATQRSVDEFCTTFKQLRFEPYAPVRIQLWSILAAVNRCRTQAGLEEIPTNVLRTRRRPTKPFG